MTIPFILARTSVFSHTDVELGHVLTVKEGKGAYTSALFINTREGEPRYLYSLDFRTREGSIAAHKGMVLGFGTDIRVRVQ